MTDVLRLPDLDLVVFRRKDALDSGLSERAITRFVREGAWVRLRHGGYTTRETWDQASEMDRHALLIRAVLMQAKSDAVASHTSALPEFGAPSYGLDLTTAHISRRDEKAGRAEAGVVQHRGCLSEADVVTSRGIRTTSATKTALDLTGILGIEGAVVQMSHLLREGHTTSFELQQRAESMAHHPHTLRTELVLRLSSELCESVLEARGLVFFWRNHFPKPILQFEVRDEQGRVVARLDAALPDRQVWFEFDGRGKYVSSWREGESAADVVLREKQREDLVRELTGWRCMRITWADLAGPVGLAARIRRFLGLDD